MNNIDNKTIDCNYKPNAAFPLDLLPRELLPILLGYTIATSTKPTNTAFALMCTSKQYCIISKELFDRDPQVLASFVRQIEAVAVAWLDKEPVSFHRNTFFFVWMVNCLKSKKIEITLNDESSQKVEIIKSKKPELLTHLSRASYGPCGVNNCQAIIECAFVEPAILEEITFSELLPLFAKSFFFEKPSQGAEYNCSLSYEILLHVAKNTSANSCFIFIEKIAAEITNKYDRKGIHGLPTAILGTNAYKLARLIESLGNYVIKETSSTELKAAYVKLIELFLSAMHWNHGSTSNTKSYLEGDHFANLALKFLQFLPDDLSDIPCSTFNLIFELKKFPEQFELVSGIIEKIKKSSHCSLENVLKIERDDVRSYFLMELANSSDASFNAEEISKVLTYLTEKKAIFLSDTKNYLKLIELMISKMPKNSQEEQAKVLELVEVFFKSVEEDFKKSQNAYQADYVLVMRGFLLYLKFGK